MTDRSPSKHTAHPRSRGENGAWCGRRVFSMGSSPLTRGKLAPPSGRGHHGGAHPRSRGENGRLHGLDEEGAGSSPLTRGKRGLHNQGLEGGRLIPAHAGKTLRRRLLRVNLRAHPRSRGENALASARGCESYGSSPLTRGKPRPGKRPRVAYRLIPAHAGKTAPKCLAHDLAQAHPRSRGENARSAWRTSRPPGSSPLTRGKRACRRQCRRQ